LDGVVTSTNRKHRDIKSLKKNKHGNISNFGKGFVPEPDKKKRKTESEKNIKKKEYANNDRKREFQNNWLKEFTWLRFDDKQYTMTCFMCKEYGSETIGPFVQRSKINQI